LFYNINTAKPIIKTIHCYTTACLLFCRGRAGKKGGANFFTLTFFVSFFCQEKKENRVFIKKLKASCLADTSHQINPIYRFMNFDSFFRDSNRNRHSINNYIQIGGEFNQCIKSSIRLSGNL
jgi:hypothetical protein